MRTVILLLLALLLLAGCSGTAVREDPSESAGPTPTRAAAALIEPTPEVKPVVFPDDEAPHDMLTEWWYYTGHLFTDSGERYGFEFVFFQANRSNFPPYFASHFAITDNARQRFVYDEKFGPGAIRDAEAGFHLALDDWWMSGALGEDRLFATLDDYAIDLNVTATKPPALHNDVGWVEFGPAGGSYYYSRTNMEVQGTLIVEGEELSVAGEAWMDHQWGNFISVGATGWDWFSVQMENNEELTISLVYGPDKEIVIAYGTIVFADGTTQNLEADAINVHPTGTWQSERTGAAYPSGWRISVPKHDWELELTPSLPDQELDTTASTGVIYWEGEVEVRGTVRGDNLTGLGYVELTGYAEPSLVQP